MERNKYINMVLDLIFSHITFNEVLILLIDNFIFNNKYKHSPLYSIKIYHLIVHVSVKNLTVDHNIHYDTYTMDFI